MPRFTKFYLVNKKSVPKIKIIKSRTISLKKKFHFTEVHRKQTT